MYFCREAATAIVSKETRRAHLYYAVSLPRRRSAQSPWGHSPRARAQPQCPCLVWYARHLISSVEARSQTEANRVSSKYAAVARFMRSLLRGSLMNTSALLRDRRIVFDQFVPNHARRKPQQDTPAEPSARTNGDQRMDIICVPGAR